MSRLDVFHAGEIAVQVSAGERAIAAARESVIRRRLNDAAIAFLESQDIVAVAAAAPDGTLWASLWCGAAGFLRGSAEGDSVGVLHDLDEHVADPVRTIVRRNEPLGLLVIDLATRRRLRINGVVHQADCAGLELSVREAFGNCPKYIQKRLRADAAITPAKGVAAPVEHGWTLDDECGDLIARADTVFVASAHHENGVDVSHRGGPPGFVHVIDDRTVRIPDYPGNSLFQSLGNIAVDSRCGLAFMDFERRRILSATGHGVLEFGVEDATHPAGGTGRYWSFTVERWVEFALPSGVCWTLVERSPFNPS